VAVLCRLLGGGSSFSTGGPGKGMYSRLYTQVLNQYSWIQSCECFYSWYSDIGLFGVHSTCDPKYAPKMLHEVIKHLLLTLVDIEEQELQRAKNLLKSSIFYNLEGRSVLVDDIGRQVLTLGKRITAEEHCKLIDACNIESIVAAAKRMFKTKPIFIAYGDKNALTQMPNHEELHTYIVGEIKTIQ